MKNFLVIFKEAYLNDPKNLEKALTCLRKSGASQMDSLKVIRHELNLSIKEADQLILNSDTWADCSNQSIDFRNSFIDFLENE